MLLFENSPIEILYVLNNLNFELYISKLFLVKTILIGALEVIMTSQRVTGNRNIKNRVGDRIL